MTSPCLSIMSEHNTRHTLLMAMSYPHSWSAGDLAYPSVTGPRGHTAAPRRHTAAPRRHTPLADIGAENYVKTLITARKA